MLPGSSAAVAVEQETVCQRLSSSIITDKCPMIRPVEKISLFVKIIFSYMCLQNPQERHCGLLRRLGREMVADGRREA